MVGKAAFCGASTIWAWKRQAAFAMMSMSMAGAALQLRLPTTVLEYIDSAHHEMGVTSTRKSDLCSLSWHIYMPFFWIHSVCMFVVHMQSGKTD